MTYEEVAAQANAAGFRVNNTFQTGEGWRANLHDGKDGFIFARGETPTEALTLALKYAKGEKGDTKCVISTPAAVTVAETPSVWAPGISSAKAVPGSSSTPSAPSATAGTTRAEKMKSNASASPQPPASSDEFD